MAKLVTLPSQQQLANWRIRPDGIEHYVLERKKLTYGGSEVWVPAVSGLFLTVEDAEEAMDRLRERLSGEYTRYYA